MTAPPHIAYSGEGAGARRPLRMPHGAVIAGILRILGDGKPRATQDLLHDGIARGLFPPQMGIVPIDQALRQYLERQSHNVRRPAIVRDPDHRFRANHPRDDWPEPRTRPQFRPPSPTSLAALDAARATSTGRDPAAFERAVCTLFESLGFLASHLGGNVAPDGYIDAPLGPLSYRVILECKTGPNKGSVAIPNPAEPARYREPYGAQACAIVGPAYRSAATLSGELHAHGVSAWTIDDLEALVHADLDLHAMRPLFAPGFAEDALADVLWEHEHGRAKRVAVIAQMLESVGLREQRLVANPSDAPRLTIEAATLCVNEALADADSDARCERADVEAAFAWLTSPLVHKAVWTDDARDAIVIVSPAAGEPTHATR
ncbi:MAG TPA: hypothetical protein VK669_02770 [Candidatus Limnocylindrales bacterium]|nr:hypothetical protein [Candidatus Limnocylindrales bacterium]